MAEASDGKAAEVGKDGESAKDTPPSQVDGKPETGDSTGTKKPVEPQNPDTQTASGGGEGKPSPPRENVEMMDFTEARDDTRHENAGDDTVQDSDEEKGPGGEPAIKHYTYAGIRIPNWIVTHYPDLVATLKSHGDYPDLALQDWENIWSSAIHQTGVITELTVTTDFIPYQCCPVIGCHYGPKVECHISQQPDAYNADKFLKHWMTCHTPENWYVICRNCAYVGRWRDDARKHFATHAKSDKDYEEFMSPKDMTSTQKTAALSGGNRRPPPIKRKHGIIAELTTSHLGHLVRARFPRDPYVDPNHLVVKEIFRTKLPDICSPAYSHWSEEGYGTDVFNQAVKPGHLGEWWSRGMEQYADPPKLLPTRSEHAFNYKSPEELKVKREKAAARKRQRSGKGKRGSRSLSKSRTLSLESLDSMGPSSKRSKDESLAEDESSATWEYKPTREEQNMDRLRKELADTKEKLQIAKLPYWQRRQRQQATSQTTQSASDTYPTPATNRSRRYKERQIRSQQFEDVTTLPVDPPGTRSSSGSRRDDMSQRSPLEQSYTVPDSMNPRVELVDSFALGREQASYQNRPLCVGGRDPSYKPGLIQTHKTSQKIAEKWQGDEDYVPTSFAGATAKAANPFPQLKGVAGDQMIANQPLSDAGKRLARGSPTPAKPADVKDAPGKQTPAKQADAKQTPAKQADAKPTPAKPADVKRTVQKPATVKPTATGTGPTPVTGATAGEGASSMQPPPPVAPVPMIAYGAPHVSVAKTAYDSRVGYDDQVDSLHGQCATRLRQIAGEVRSRTTARSRPEPSDTDVALFRQSMEWFSATTLHYRDRRTALLTMEHTYEELGSEVMLALAARCETMVDIFSQEKERTAVLRKERDDLRRQMAKADAEVKRVKKALIDSQKKSSLCEIREKAMANDLLRKNDRLKRWKSCYHHLNVEKMDLYRERVDLNRRGLLDMSSDANIRISTCRPPTPDPEEESEEFDDQLEIDPLTPAELAEMDRTRFASGPSQPSQGPATTIAATPTPFKLVSPTPTLVLRPPEVDQSALDREALAKTRADMLTLQSQLTMLASRAGMADIMSPPRPSMSSRPSSTVTSQQAADSLFVATQRVPTPPPLPPPPPDQTERQSILPLNLTEEVEETAEELLAACQISQSQLDTSLTEAEDAFRDQIPSVIAPLPSRRRQIRKRKMRQWKQRSQPPQHLTQMVMVAPSIAHHRVEIARRHRRRPL